MKTLIEAFVTSLSFTLFTGKLFIPLLKRIKFGQPILKYVETHKNKSGTPTMGGLFFILSAIVVFVMFGGTKGRIATVSAVIGLAFLAVGFLDDLLKIKLKHNEGLKAYQKIIFQTAISLFAGIFAFNNGLTVFYIPFSRLAVDLGVWTIPIVAIVFVATTNSVNLTDGLDSLAGGVSVIYLLTIFVLTTVQISMFKSYYIDINEYNCLKLLCVVLVGGILGFLVFNVNKAKVFMGDTGSLALGGLIGAISIFSSNAFFIPIIGITFVCSSISVIVQVLVFKTKKRRVFLMAPLHHHFQLKGYSESQISFCYSLITLIMGLISVYFYV